MQEKCLDMEVHLQPTSADACESGLSSACPDRVSIAAASEAAGLTNIRIIKRIERLADAFRKAIPRQQLQEESLPAYILHSLAFLAVLHYEGRFSNEQVETFLEEWSLVCADQLRHATLGDAASLAMRCSVTFDHELLSLLSNFVLHHPLNATRVAEHMQAADERARQAEAQRAAQEYVDRARYDPNATDQNLVEFASIWCAKGWQTLAPETVSTIILDLERRGGQRSALLVAEAWSKHWRKSSKEYVQESLLLRLAEPIAKAIRETNESRRPMRSVMDVIEQIQDDLRSASDANIQFLQNIAIGLLRKYIEAYEHEDLKRFLKFYSEQLPGLEAELGNAKLAWNKFKTASNDIIVANKSPRLSEILLHHVRMRCPDFEAKADEQIA